MYICVCTHVHVFLIERARHMFFNTFLGIWVTLCGVSRFNEYVYYIPEAPCAVLMGC